MFPVKAVQKLDRHGIGVETQGNAKSPKYVFNVKRLNLERASGKASSSKATTLESQLKSFQNAEKRRNKEKDLERGFRSYFNS